MSNSNVYSPHHTSIFLVFEQSSRHPASQHQVYRAEHTSLIEHIAAAPSQERSVARGAGGWCLVSRKAVAPEMDTFFCVWVIDFRTLRHRIGPGGGRRVRGGAAKEFHGHEQF